MILTRQYFSVHIKRNLAYPWFIYGACFHCVFCSYNPRLTLKQENAPLLYNRNYSHTVLFHQEGSMSLFVGGINNVLHFDVGSRQIVENFTLNPNLRCGESPCENVVTIIERFQDYTFVCGTNGDQPKCWKLFPRESNHSTEVVDGTGISPYTCSQNSLSLVADGDLYVAAPLYSDGTLLQFRRKAGQRNSVWMYDQWVSEPTFISSFLAKDKNDPLNEKIYVLFREKNSDTSPEADPWISRVARVCKVDEGGPKQLLQNIWTSFLKARLVCGIPRESLYFNRLQDVFIQHADDWRDSQVYALFSSSWNSTAVCIYSLAELDFVFEHSTFKGYSEAIPTPRPGMCVKQSNSIPISTLQIIKDHPDMKDWIHPIQKDTPFFTSNKNFTKIAVDRVQASDESIHSVLLLAKDNGVILKILEDGSKAFIISETHLCNGSAPVHSMKLDSEKRKLFVGYPGQISVLDLQRCQDYNASCEECVLSRDPYCAWTEQGCTSQTKGGIQNIADGLTKVCHQKSEGRFTRDVQQALTAPLGIELSVPTGVPFYLSCPVDSNHATYKWEHDQKSIPGQQTQSECLLLIPAMTTDIHGNYKCTSHELDYTKTVREYNLLIGQVRSASNDAFKLRAQDWLMAAFATSAFYLRSL
ncbi:semaphorin-7A-like isoform X1 [Sinocyclocheilus anshuiensis]|uniref:semaphorin-7A-like isoform X1 n=1 Tax=Sinocyclocheilus anshuiensis TaxID=1608454 RepID=UPI0007B8C723|nr:PREDICTED: semaphorin-7A-like isoform X1 [Sinocyclocheilus anshuiensis]